MRPRTLRARYLIPISKLMHWAWFLASAIGIVTSLAAVLVVFPSIPLFLEPWMNLVLFTLAVLSMLAWSISMFSDKRRFQQQLGLIFEDDWLYIYQIVRKIKIRYDDLKNVTFYPSLKAPDKKKDRRSGRAAWILIQTKQRQYLLRIPNYEDAFPQLQKYRVPFQENRKKLPTVLFGLIATTVVSLGFTLIPVTVVLSLQRFFSNNGFLSRRSELLLPLLGIGILIVPVSMRPLSYVDRQSAMISDLAEIGQDREVRLYCDRLLPEESPEVIGACARFYVFSKDPEVRSYKKAQDLSTDALNRASTVRQLKAYADTLACASMGLGQFAHAEKIARDYELPERAEQISRQEICIK